jgi:hypothetical protein
VNNALIVGIGLVTATVVGVLVPLAAPPHDTKYFPAFGTAEAVRSVP